MTPDVVRSGPDDGYPIPLPPRCTVSTPLREAHPDHKSQEIDMAVTTTHLTGIRAVSIPVDDQEAAVQFYVGSLGFTKLRDNPTPNGGRWIELAAGADGVVVTLERAASDVTRGAIGIRFSTDSAAAAHHALQTAGVDVDEILRWPGVPPMFSFRDPDGNAFSVTESS
jgi:catechol 2,3-dioxygenase-like lactoylglutathione lyase family enzyme